MRGDLRDCYDGARITGASRAKGKEGDETCGRSEDDGNE